MTDCGFPNKILLYAFITLCICVPVTPSMAQEELSQATRKQLTTFVLPVQGFARNYDVFVPSWLSQKEPVPLVLMLHGGGGTGRAAMWETGWAQKAEKKVSS